ncbi:MAG: hypothetical protein U0031_11045 [Thermomicrobiales bacterium]
MDGQRFDRLTVHVTGALTRRRFGRLLLGIGLGGTATLAEAAVAPQPARAFRCANGATKCCTDDGPVCDGECCGPRCYVPSQAYCADEAHGDVCPLTFSFCRVGASATCCPPNSQCCGGNTCCFEQNHEFCPRPQIGRCCPTGATVCDRTDGNFICCAARTECCGNNVCCDIDREFCAFPNAEKCCKHGEIACRRASDGVVSCRPDPPCPLGEILDQTTCQCRPCENSLVWCGGHCILPCADNQVLDFNTCSCHCVGEECGGQCCPLGKVCASAGGNWFPPKCCAPDDICAGVCKSDPGILCCGSGPSATACAAGTQSCCAKGAKGGGGCCRREDQVCDHGRCVAKKKKKKHKKR